MKSSTLNVQNHLTSNYSIYLEKLVYSLHLSDFVINHFLLDALELIF